jgi:hypothetical protein
MVIFLPKKKTSLEIIKTKNNLNNPDIKQTTIKKKLKYEINCWLLFASKNFNRNLK